ncbi:hypothetical protein MMC11_007538 [Xylographa trunciseda]|nr:hypothetical protein [Xylographa trunciseda]
MPAPPFNQMFPPAPTYTEKDVGDLTGKVFIVTGSTSGCGFELAKMLYMAGGKVYVAARSPEKIQNAIRSITSAGPSPSGKLVALSLDLADLSSIKQSATAFLGAEERLDVLVHNAGVMKPPPGSKTKTGHDLEMGTNCLGPFLFNRFLEGILKSTAASAPPNSVRIVWLASMIAFATPPGGVLWNEKTQQPRVLTNTMENYMASKAGDAFLASECAKRLGGSGVISVSVHPGLIKTELQRHGGAVQAFILGFILKPGKFGAYTELFAACSPQITTRDSGKFIIPWGRLGPIPDHIQEAMKSKSEGGTGNAERFWAWCETETKGNL